MCGLLYAVCWDGLEMPWETVEILSSWCGITEEGVHALAEFETQFDFERYRRL